jgi:TPP-dependent pyruvate/acetoin dehydrogenase alpha subunit
MSAWSESSEHRHERKEEAVSVTKDTMVDEAVAVADRALLERMFHTVSVIAACHERLQSGIQRGEFEMMYYPVRGQEMIPTGAAEALRPDDYMVTNYRCLHDVIAKGTPLREVLAEMLGRVSGTSKGKGGPMHLADPSSGLMVTSGIVGGGVPIANGLALGAKLRKSEQVTVASFGDGATSIGGTHEAFNLASLWDLPVIFLLQNNQYGEHTAVSGYTKTKRFSDRAAGYGMAGVTTDGNDPLAVYEVMTAAVERARAGGGPTLVECVTHRLMGHVMGAETAYMDQTELKAAWAVDPIPVFRSRLVSSGRFDDAELSKIESQAVDLVEDAMTYGLQSDVPPLEELCVDVFADEKDVLQ